ncbi:MAG: hypothetical protein K9J06_01750 [Flavobacteriales bacterium]|nr:hypothetical protein [Flavobacteriales bacterium]
MSPKSIARVRGVLFMMDANERTVLRNYLQCFESRKKGHKPKTLMLLDLLEKYSDDHRVSQLFSKKVLTADARRMVLSRLYEKVLASLTLDVNIVRQEVYDDIAQARAQVAQGKIAAQMLVARGQRDAGLRELERSIMLAKKYELFHDLMEMLFIKRQYRSGRTSDSEVSALKDEILLFSAIRDAEVRARTYFDEVTRQYGFKGLNHAVADSERLAFVETRVNELAVDFEVTKAAIVGYYYHLLRVELHQLQGQLEEAARHLLQLSHIVEHSPAIRNRIRLATAYANSGANAMWMHQFEESADFFKESLTHLRPNSRNHALMMEYLFRAQFYSGNLIMAKRTLESLVSDPAIDQSEFQKAVRGYLMACVEFCLGNHGNVRRFLSHSQTIGQDKEGWNIGLRVLNILNAIDLADYDHADALILNLRQFVREGLKLAVLRPRDKHIVDILVELRRLGYDFAAVAHSKDRELGKLKQRTGVDAWQVQTPELICFHTWFNNRLQGRRYEVDYTSAHLYG